MSDLVAFTRRLTGALNVFMAKIELERPVALIPSTPAARMAPRRAESCEPSSPCLTNGWQTLVSRNRSSRGFVFRHKLIKPSTRRPDTESWGLLGVYHPAKGPASTSPRTRGLIHEFRT